MRVYPRVCGGAALEIAAPEMVKGLSPRVRGSPRRGLYLCDVVGSIPACAGEPMSMRAGLHRPRVYPRVCGGARFMAALTRRLWGLSPRVRGSQGGHAAIGVARGSIPACAGEPVAPQP